MRILSMIAGFQNPILTGMIPEDGYWIKMIFPGQVQNLGSLGFPYFQNYPAPQLKLSDRLLKDKPNSLQPVLAAAKGL